MNIQLIVKNGRCVVCGAKIESHDEDHKCRFHRDENGVCLVCGDKQ